MVLCCLGEASGLPPPNDHPKAAGGAGRVLGQGRWPVPELCATGNDIPAARSARRDQEGRDIPERTHWEVTAATFGLPRKMRVASGPAERSKYPRFIFTAGCSGASTAIFQVSQSKQPKSELSARLKSGLQQFQESQLQKKMLFINELEKLQ